MSNHDLLASKLALRMGDNALVLSQGLCEWIGATHDTEEDLAQANIALDLLGQARSWLTLTGKLDGTSRNENDLAYFRDEDEFESVSLVEQPNGDFGCSICRQFLFDAWHVAQLELLCESKNKEIADISATAHREVTYHLRHSSAWFARLADGTDESRGKVLSALDKLWPLCGELLVHDGFDRKIAKARIGPDSDAVLQKWRDTVARIFSEGRVDVPPESLFVRGLSGKSGNHTEHLGPMLAVMQSVARRHRGASW